MQRVTLTAALTLDKRIFVDCWLFGNFRLFCYSMSGGRKKSGFQITSVTSDYDRGGNERRQETFNKDAKGLDGQESSHLTDGDQNFKMLSFTNSPPNLNVFLPAARRGSAPEACRSRILAATETGVGSGREIVSVTSCGVLATDNAALLVAGSTNPLVGSSVTSCPSSCTALLSTSSANTSEPVRPSVLSPTGSLSPRVSPGVRSVTLTPSRDHDSLVTGTASASRSKANEALLKNVPASALRASPVTTPVSGSSRFRVVKLTPGLGEPYKKGRWTCVDFYDKDSENTTISKILDSTRHPHSLDSSRLVRNQDQNLSHSQTGLNVANALGQNARSFCGVSHLITDLTSGTHRAQSSCDSGVSSRTGSPQPSGQPSQLIGLQSIDSTGAGSSGVCSQLIVTNCETCNLSMGESDSLGSAGMSESRQHLHPDQQRLHVSRCSSPAFLPMGVNMVPMVIVEDMSSGSKHAKSTDMLVMQSFDMVDMGKDSRSRSQSPCPLSVTDGTSLAGPQDMMYRNTPRLSLTKMIPDTGASHDSDDDSGSSSSMIAIDNKIERAMDLVKSHLMYAVREEVEVLKEQIKELTERNALLEQENNLLRSLASPEQLSQVTAKVRSGGLSVPPQTGTTSS
ncbi:TSC22 domain family protein 4 [Protopterus annectens]|uniref:TSC22 domain family protein 4 n=1 Tax=Protopterus annectens TaxID=7888 RepID=UPI001CFB08E2|nr:TSC22 domain family protein 4 [Protopterus annectens]